MRLGGPLEHREGYPLCPRLFTALVPDSLQAYNNSRIGVYSSSQVQHQRLMRKPLKPIRILSPRLSKPGRLTIDVVVKQLSGPYHISRLTHGRKGLYDVARTYESPGSPVDIHASCHPGGEMHCKLTRGKLVLHPEGQILGEAQPHTKAKEVILWQRQGQPWQSLKGVERFAQHPRGVVNCMNISALAAGYPVYSHRDADYVFEIGTESLPSSDADIEYFLVEPGNVAALEDAIRESACSWQRPRGSLTLERAGQLANLSPWFAIVVFAGEESD